MITTLSYQIKDLKEFVLEDLQRRGYSLAPGAEPKLVDLAGLDDPDQLAIEVKVVDRPIEKVLKKEVAAPTPVLAAPAAVTSPGKKSNRGNYKLDQALTKEEQEKQEAKRTKWREAAQAKRERLAAQKQLEADTAETDQVVPDPKPLTATFQQEILNSIEEIKRGTLEVVAPTIVPFRTADLFQQTDGLLNGSPH